MDGSFLSSWHTIIPSPDQKIDLIRTNKLYVYINVKKCLMYSPSDGMDGSPLSSWYQQQRYQCRKEVDKKDNLINWQKLGGMWTQWRYWRSPLSSWHGYQQYHYKKEVDEKDNHINVQKLGRRWTQWMCRSPPLSSWHARQQYQCRNKEDKKDNHIKGTKLGGSRGRRTH